MTRRYGTSIRSLLLVAATAFGGQAGVASRAAAEGEPANPAGFSTRVAPAFAVAPAEVRVEILVEPSDDNRGLDIVVDSSDYYRNSTISLDGARAPRFHTVEYRGMPAGTYTVLVRLRARQGVSRAVQHTLLVVR